MKIIDAHLHFNAHPGFQDTARAAGHENSAAHLLEVFRQNHIVLGVAMGSGAAAPDPACSAPRLPDLAGAFRLDRYTQPDRICYCCGVGDTLTRDNLEASLELFERHLRTPECVGLKLYPGYQQIRLDDPLLTPFYELAAHFDAPVVIHTGDTARPDGVLKYAHPLALDEVAVRFPGTRFVMAHYGNPWIVDATAVAAKNPNVYLDLSGLAAGNFDAAWFLDHYRAYWDYLAMWLTYLGNFDKVMYGSDWPLVNIPAYLEVIARLIPEPFQEAVFYRSALGVFPKIAALLNDKELES